MKTCFDIGANIGECTQWFLDQNYDKVISIEPGAEAFSQLFQKFNNNPRVIMHYLAISDKPGTIKFWNSNWHTTSTAAKAWVTNSRFSGKCAWEAVIKNAITIDELINLHGLPNFLKVDVEGYELEVFKGLTHNRIETIAFEWAEEEYTQLNNIVQYLKSIGYNEFSFTYADNLSDSENLFYTEWEKLDIHLDIIPSRKERWGMVYAK
jgi:FkbM family methyltransferase